MRFVQNVLRMTWKERFVQFSWKAPCFKVLARNWRQCDDFWEVWCSKMRFDQNVLRMTWKERFVQFSWKAHCFKVLARKLGQCDDFKNFDTQKCDLVKTCCPWPEKSVFYNSHKKRTVFPFWGQFQASLTIVTTLTLKNAIWPKRAEHDLKRAFCTVFMKSALFSRFEDNFRPMWRFWHFWCSKMRFDQNVLPMTWKERFVQFSWKAHCFKVLARSSRQYDDFENFDALKCDLAKTCCSRPEKSVFYKFHEKRTVFPFWREFEASVTILTTLTLKMWFGQNVLRVTLKERFVQILWKAHCFLVFKRISGQCDDFDNFDAQKCDLPKTCC